MNEVVELNHQTLSGLPLKASFDPQNGMKLISFVCGNREMIDQAALQQGFGGVIGPHFGQRKPSIIPEIKNLPPALKERISIDPFPNGVARVASWRMTSTSPISLKAVLTGKDTWEGIPLSQLEEQNFTMTIFAELKPSGLFLLLSVVSEADSLIGIQCPFSLSDGQGKVISAVKNYYYHQGERLPLPSHWSYDFQGILTYHLSHSSADDAFHPFLNPLEGKIDLQTPSYTLKTLYSCKNQENSWHLFHPEASSFVCMTPVSSQNPWKPNLTASEIAIHYEI